MKYLSRWDSDKQNLIRAGNPPLAGLVETEENPLSWSNLYSNHNCKDPSTFPTFFEILTSHRNYIRKKLHVKFDVIHCIKKS